MLLSFSIANISALPAFPHKVLRAILLQIYSAKVHPAYLKDGHIHL